RDMRMMPFWDSNAEIAHVIFGFRYFNAGLVLTFIEPLGVFYRVGIFELGAFDLVALRITLRKEFQLVAKFFSVICFHERAPETFETHFSSSCAAASALKPTVWMARSKPSPASSSATSHTGGGAHVSMPSETKIIERSPALPN